TTARSRKIGAIRLDRVGGPEYHTATSSPLPRTHPRAHLPRPRKPRTSRVKQPLLSRSAARVEPWIQVSRRGGKETGPSPGKSAVAPRAAKGGRVGKAQYTHDPLDP